MIELNDMHGGIYLITNRKTNKIYIGQAEVICFRIKSHAIKLANNKHSNKHLQRSYNKYGNDIFVVKVLEYVSDEIQQLIDDKHNKTDEIKKIIQNHLNELEVKWIALYKEKGYFLYNQNDGGDGHNPNNEVREKIGIASKERWEDKEYRMKHKEAIRNGFTEESKRKLSKKSIETWKDSTVREKRIAGLNKSNTDEVIEKRRHSIIKAYKNPKLIEHIKKERSERFNDENYKKKFSKSVRKALNNADIKQKLSDISKEHWKNEDYRNKVVEGVRKAVSKQEYKDKLSKITTENMKNPELRKRISDTMKKIKEEKRKEIETYNNILWMVFQVKPSLKKRSLEWKKQMVERLAKEFSKLNKEL